MKNREPLNPDIPIMLDGSDAEEARQAEVRFEATVNLFDDATLAKFASLDTREKEEEFGARGLDLMRVLWASAVMDVADSTIECNVDPDELIDLCMFCAWIIEKSGRVLFPDDPDFSPKQSRMS